MELESFNAENYNKNRMIMLIDDQVIVGESIRQMIAKVDDLNFHYCQFPAQTLSLIEEVEPAVILLDIMMPDIDGITLLRYIRQNPKMANIPVVMLSSNGESSEKATAFEAGANDYLVKIPDEIELIARLRYHSSYYNSLVQRDYAFHALKVSQNKLVESNLELQRVATIDSLTELYNRRYFDEKSSIEWARSLREQLPISIIILDIDLFKQCNDVYGHATGDEYLKKVAHSLSTSLSRKTDIVARYGGEEFIVLLPNTDIEGALTIAEKMRQNVVDLSIEHPTLDCVSISLGVSCVTPAENFRLEDLIKCADTALYRAKDSGRNKVEHNPFIIDNAKIETK